MKYSAAYFFTISSLTFQKKYAIIPPLSYKHMHDHTDDEEKIITDSELSDDSLDDVTLEDDSLTPAAKLKELRDKLKVTLKERDDNLAGWQRAKADMVNFKRQAAEESKGNVNSAIKNVLSDLLPVLDSFDMAIGSPSWETIDPTWRKGMEGVYAQALGAARTHGLLQTTPNLGDEFDPNTHEAVGTEQTDRDSNDHRIAKVLQKGYALNGIVIRPAKVIIYSHEY